jgi:hypothetical protein
MTGRTGSCKGERKVVTVPAVPNPGGTESVRKLEAGHRWDTATYPEQPQENPRRRSAFGYARPTAWGPFERDTCSESGKVLGFFVVGT